MKREHSNSTAVTQRINRLSAKNCISQDIMKLLYLKHT